MSFVYTQLLEELKDRWRIEVQAALTGWHFACVMSDPDGRQPDRPKLPDWLDVRRSFDVWLASDPADADDAPDKLSAEDMDVMIAYGWKDTDDES